jgi:large subunit ribosomal protein L22
MLKSKSDISKETRATLSSLRISPRKLNLVAQLIRNLPVHEALSRLTFCKRRISKDALKLLKSGISNAENNHQLNIDRLVVAQAYVGKSMVMKRFHARARGNSASIKKFFSHLTIILREEENA